MNTKTEFDAVFTQLSHDLKNDLISIRAAAGSIKKNISSQEIIESKLVTINQVIDQVMTRLETTRNLLSNNQSDSN